MSVTHVDVLVEEPSMEALLRKVLPRVVPRLTFEIFTFLSKDDLLKRLPDRLRGYSRWLPAERCIVVVVDRDDDDCLALKHRLEHIAHDAGLSTRATAGRGAVQVVNRIAVEELEAWYFGDWQAVRAAFPKVPATTPEKAAFRHPDAIRGGTWEQFERVLQAAGYFAGGLRKIEAARVIGERMDPARSRSPSFCALRDALLDLA